LIQRQKTALFALAKPECASRLNLADFLKKITAFHVNDFTYGRLFLNASPGFDE